MSSQQKKNQPKQTRPIAEFNDRIGFIPVKQLDRVLIGVTILFLLAVIINTFVQVNSPSLYLIMKQLHYHISRYALFIALLMFGIAIFIGLFKHADVTPYYRRGTYAVWGLMIFTSLVGSYMYFIVGTRPDEDVHVIYGVAAILALPFFIFVEKTAEKRPAMGSYMWAFFLLMGMIVRSISTGS